MVSLRVVHVTLKPGVGRMKLMRLICIWRLGDQEWFSSRTRMIHVTMMFRLIEDILELRIVHDELVYKVSSANLT